MTKIRHPAPPAKRRPLIPRLIALATLGSGLVNLYSVLGPPLPERAAILHGVFPLEFLHLSRFVTLLMGFSLVILSFNVYKRKRRAFVAAAVLACLSVAFHLTKGLDFEEATFSLVLLVVLLLDRKEFTVKSGIPQFSDGIIKVGIGLGVTLAYGIFGFWVFDRREFGIDFTLAQAIESTVSLLLANSEPYLVPHTAYARWFLQSFYLITVTAMIYGVLALFRPVIYRYRTQPQEHAFTRELIARYGRTSLDFFKSWQDKSYFFSTSHHSFIAYRVAGKVAIALSDPIGPEAEIHQVTRDFISFCEENDWTPAFYQTTPEYLRACGDLGLHKLKIGDDAIVDLQKFSIDGKDMKKVRNKIHNLEKSGIHTVWYDAPVPDDVLAQAKAVSDDWLRIPGRRERTFTLGMFKWDYLKGTPLFAAVDANGQMLAFVNVIRSYFPGETTVDLMRHRGGAPNGTMDYLFVKLLLHSREQGFKRFNLGMAPMSGFHEKDEASLEEKAVHYFFQRMNFIFSYAGLMHYKAKFANLWEPRYIIYERVLDLPRIAVALAKVSELKEERA